MLEHTIDTMDSSLWQRLLARGRNRGYITFRDILKVLPEVERSLEELEELYILLEEEGIRVQEDGPEPSRAEKELVDKWPGEVKSAGRTTATTCVELEPAGGDQEELVSLDDIESDDTISLYFREVGHTPLLTAQEEVDLAKRMERGQAAQRRLLDASTRSTTAMTCAELEPAASAGDDSRNSEEEQWLKEEIRAGEAARQRLITANSRLVISMAKKYRGHGVPFLDLIQEGNLGLMRAVEKFDYQRGFKFSTYATWWIRQAISRALADQGRTIRIPVHLSDRIRKLYHVSQDLEQDLGRQPTPEEIAEETNIPPRKVRRMLRISQHTLSLEKPVGDEGDSQLGQFIESERTPDPAEEATRESLREDVERLMTALTPREVRILQLRYGLRDGRSHTLKEVGYKFGLTRERIRQIEQGAIRKLRRRHRAEKLKAYMSD
jgi:RNA polymerase primary sigma factor